MARPSIVESGLNDGLALPFVLLGASLASMASEHLSGAALAWEAVSEVVLGVVAGIVVGWVAAVAMSWAQDRQVMQKSAGAVLFLLAAFTAYVLADLVGERLYRGFHRRDGFRQHV